jgi:hypothetical protein
MDKQEFAASSAEHDEELILKEAEAFFLKVSEKIAGRVCTDDQFDHLFEQLNKFTHKPAKKMLLEDECFTYVIWYGGLRKGDMIRLEHIRGICFSYKEKTKSGAEYCIERVENKDRKFVGYAYHRSFIHIGYVVRPVEGVVYAYDSSDSVPRSVLTEAFWEAGIKEKVYRSKELSKYFPECAETHWHEFPEYKKVSRMNGCEKVYGRSYYLKTMRDGEEVTTHLILWMCSPESLKDAIRRHGSRKLLDELREMNVENN